MNSLRWEELRRRAEAKLNAGPEPSSERLVHELEVHQVELEMQNEELQTTQVELEASRERYRDLFSFAPVGYVVLGPAGVIEANETAARLLGVRSDELVGMHLESFLLAESASAFALHRRAVLESMDRVSAEVAMSTRSRQRRELRLDSVCTSVIRQQWRMTLTDVTEQRRLERQLADAMRVEVGGPVTRAMAHDMRHVLMAVLGSADAALQRLEPEHAARTPLEDLKKIAVKAGSLVDGLLDRARGRRGGAPLSDVDAAVMRSDAMLRRVVGSGVSIRYELNAPVAVELTEPEIDQILLNLVSNARDALPRGGEIRVCTRVDASLPASVTTVQDHVVLSVSDRGVGMDATVLRRAFDPFFSTKSADRGTGLGLSTVQAIVCRRGGEVELLSELGRGTTVRVLLPRSSARVQVPPEPAAASAGALAVLVVDDHDFVRLAARRSLEKDGHRVVLAASGEQALELIAAGPRSFSLILSDVGLPGISGAELAERAIARQPGLRCLLMSEDDPLELISSNRVPPGTDVVRKPFRPNDLAERVRRALSPRPLVLLVEDDPVACATYKDLLADQGFRVLIARSGREALDACSASPDDVSVVMSDFNLPDMDGGTLLEALRRTRPQLPVVLVTGRTRDDPALSLSLAAPQVHVVTKPVDVATLARALWSSLPPLLPRPSS